MYKFILVIGILLMLTSCSSGGGYSNRYMDIDPDYVEYDEPVYTLEEAKDILYDEIFEEGYDEGYEEGYADHTTEISDQIDDVLSGYTSFDDFVYDNQ